MNKQQLIQQLKTQGIHSPVVLAALENTPRELFVPDVWQAEAYANQPLPIGHQQTISQPFIVARMTELLLADKPRIGKVLEVGTGSGYQAAILAQLADAVYSIERILPLLKQARTRFTQLKLNNIYTLHGDGHQGWPEHAPYDGILVTAAATTPPAVLLEQLADGGKLLLPIGQPAQLQELQLITRHGKTFTEERLEPVIFVPMLTGRTTE